ncbi:MAG TPA: hypothetical protein VKI44_23040 [Acetobacteraceae bacterium]|nr:hypothetical protein [Acetobacteraceae bacterium]
MEFKFILSAAAVMAISAPAQAVSFDCRHATTPDELTICSDPRLSEMDDVVAAAFNQVKRTSDAATVVRVARDLLADRRLCQANKTCILSNQLATLEAFRNAGAQVATPPWISALVIAGGMIPARTSLPTSIGQCALTQVAGITPRLDFGHQPTSQDFDSGTAITFANGGQQVSYEREEALLHSRPGDRVVMCLISIPRNCPPGDDRGRVYTVTNMRTNETWSLPDAQHMCGGA